MNNLNEKSAFPYQMRYAAGLYWILDMEQKGVPYRKPLATNEVGARIWKAFVLGETEEGIAEKLSVEYQVSRDEIREDIAQFWLQLEQYGIDIRRQSECFTKSE